MAFPDDEAREEELDDATKLQILETLGGIAQDKYDEFIVQGGNSKGYNLHVLRGSLQFTPDVQSFENEYYLQGPNDHWTDVAAYFEYGTGLYNTGRAGRYRAGYIKPIIEEYMTFVAKDGKFVRTKRVKGVHPIFAMEKAIKFIEFNRKKLQEQILDVLSDRRKKYVYY